MGSILPEKEGIIKHGGFFNFIMFLFGLIRKQVGTETAVFDLVFRLINYVLHRTLCFLHYSTESQVTIIL